MAGRAPKISSGIDPLDGAWGGFYLGGSYLVYGRAAGGRRLVPITVARAAAAAGERTLMILTRESDEQTPASPESDSGLRELGASGLLETVGPSQLGLTQDAEDDQLYQSIRRLVATAKDLRPGRVVIDDFMPFVRFRSFRRFRASFISMLEDIDAVDATLVLLMAEPANEASEHVIEFMRRQMTAAIHVTQSGSAADSARRTLHLIPNIGHIGAQTEVPWDVRSVVNPEGDAHPAARRFRFAEDFSDDVSPIDAEWDASSTFPDPGGDHVRPDSVPAIQPSSIDISAQKSVTPFRLGRQEGSDVRAEESRRSPTPVPLGRRGRSESQSTPTSPHRAPLHREVYRAMIDPDVSDASVAQSEPEAPVRTATSASDRDAFRMRLQQHFLHKNVNGSSFLLIAMRMERTGREEERPFDFEFIHDLVNELLRDEDDVYVDVERERLVVLLAETRPEEAQQFFAQLKKRLREEAPRQADVLLKSVSAIVVPDGEPFQNAEEFLTYALDEG